MNYFSLTNLGDDAPYGVIRQNGHAIERYVPTTDEWVEAPGEWDYLTGNEPGARQISVEDCENLIEGGGLAQISRDVLR